MSGEMLYDVMCDCGYMVCDLRLDRAERFAEQHTDEECDPRIALAAGDYS